jgi:transposase InsO family protein
MTEAIYLEISEKTEAAKKQKRRVSVSGMLKFLGVSRSGYHAWLKRVPSDTQKRRETVKVKIQDIYNKSNQIYGAPKITKELRKNGEIISQRTVGKYMKELGIKAHWIKPWTVTTIDSDFSNELQNILDEQFNPERPNAVWCSDITYIWTTDGFVYLTSIMDLFSRKIIAWTLSNTLEVSCVIDTINKAKARRNTDLPLIIHSDRGSQYVSKAYQKATANMQRSYSKKAFPWDNACIESFHALIKREWINRFKIRNYRQAYQLIFEYVEAFYNTKRIHSHCDYMSPNDFEKLYEKVQAGELLLAS